MKLDELLAEETRWVEQFVRLLTDEQKLLTSSQVSDLQGITDQKNTLIELLTKIASQRDELLRAAGLPASSEGLIAWVTINADQALTHLFDRLKQISSEAKRLNELNAQLVNIRLQVTQQALSVLLPQEQSPALYDTLGQSSQRVGYKLIDSA
jgi:flagellar biosynthesis protein FlgN